MTAPAAPEPAAPTRRARKPQTFKASDLRRLIRTARAEGLPVERMGIAAEAGRLCLLPPGDNRVTDEPELDAELEAWRQSNGNGRP